MNISPQVLLNKIEEAKKLLQSNSVFKEMCKEFKVSPKVIDIIPVRFGQIDVSAKTVRGIIVLSFNLLKDGEFEKNIHYLLHEISHFLQMSTRNHPTKGSKDGEYLDNKDEVEAFTYQVELLDDLFGEPKAENYVENLLNYHDIENGKDRKKKHKELTKRIDTKEP